MKLSSLSSLFVLLVFLVPSSASVLGDLAIAMPERTFVKLPPNQSLVSLNFPGSSYAFSDSGCWDPVRRLIHWITSGGSCCSDGTFNMITYNVDSNQWSIAVSGVPKGIGHAYDGNTADPATGDLYFTQYYNKVCYKYNGQSWSTLPPISTNPTAAMGLAWFPELNGGKGGLVHVSEAYQVAWYDGVKWTTIPAPALSWGSYHVFAEYNPVGKFVWLGGGNGGERIHYKLDAQLKLTKFNNAPVNLSSASVSLNSVDPVSGKFIVTETADLSWWEFDPVADRWTQITSAVTGRPPYSNPELLAGFQVPIPEYGVILYCIGGRNNVSQREVYLYKHTQGSSVEQKKIMLNGNSCIRVSPNPFQGNAFLAILSPSGMAEGLALFTVDGKRVPGQAGLKDRGIIDGSSLSAGVYVLQGEINGKRSATKIIKY